MAARAGRFAPGTGVARATAGSSTWPQHLHDISERFFFWSGRGHARHVRPQGQLQPVDPARRARAAHGQHGGRHDPRPGHGRPRSPRCSTTSPSTSGPAPDASPAVLCGIAHMQTDEGVWYPVGGTRAVPTALAELAAELGVELRTGDGGDAASTSRTARVRARADRRRRAEPVDAVVSNMDARADLPRAGRRRRGHAASTTARATSRPAPAWCSISASTAATSTWLHHDFVFSRDPEEEFDFIYKRGEPAPDPTCYLAAPSRTEPDGGARRAARRSTSWSTPPTCARTTTGRACSPPTARRSSTS